MGPDNSQRPRDFAGRFAPAPLLTPRRHRLFRFVCRYFLDHGVGPSRKEIAAHLGSGGGTYVTEHLVRLRDAGLIDYERGVCRSAIPLRFPADME